MRGPTALTPFLFWFFLSAFGIAALDPVAAEPTPVVIDIRTPAEWRETGVIDGALLLSFFDERGGYDAEAFLGRLRRVVEPDAPLVLVCRTGNRTGAVMPFLEQHGFAHVAHVDGGMMHLLDEGVSTVMPPADAFAPTTDFGALWRCTAADDTSAAGRCAEAP